MADVSQTSSGNCYIQIVTDHPVLSLSFTSVTVKKMHGEKSSLWLTVNANFGLYMEKIQRKTNLTLMRLSNTIRQIPYIEYVIKFDLLYFIWFYGSV